ncbi:molybdopterin-dependent oxidoreductase [Actinomadura sp. WMMB 499]|uniref:molybdopterin-dependent oxidoreductase n=1 Tax=Actinomadura sp. WMMB 499 TaxID=1219491 RepID=UPI00124455A1|nr:molybdopterin-dependent oxidoreductase [Actinomadura sp. WMMB 499]QFG20608.1 molybdopterin-dependent oxidoreductase [Actinomadura sp. WMMB 499]
MTPTPLPPGQAAAPLHRFGLPRFAARLPRVPDDPAVTVTGAVRRPSQYRAADLTALPGRAEHRADLHCVTTWSALDLRWTGVPFAAVHAHLAERAGVSARARWVAFTGLDGYRATLRLDDALVAGVVLADSLDGRPLTAAEGGPLRLAAPAQYGYKSVKHVYAIEYLTRYDAGSAGWLAHPRGRVDREERSLYLPGRVWRPLWRALLPRVRRVYYSSAV